MNVIVSAVLLWAFTAGMLGYSWLWLVFAVTAGLFAMRRLGVALTDLSPAGLLSAFFAAIAFASNLYWHQAPNDQLQAMSWLHYLVTTQAIGVSSDARALVLGLTIGDDSSLSVGLASALKTVSLTHLSAVSGANCAIVIAAVYFALAHFRLRTRVTAAVMALAGYVALVGPQPSVLRAATMAVFVLFAIGSGRKVKPMVALALSIDVLIAISPALITSVSFILSVAATAGLLWFAPIITAKFNSRLPKALAVSLAVSISAQLFCLPILLQLQGGIPTYSLLANVLAEPLVAPITILGIIAVCFAWMPPIATALYWVASLFAWLIALIAASLARLPFATLPWRLDGWGEIFIAGLMIFLLVWFAARSNLLKNVSLVLVLILSLGTLSNVVNRAVAFLNWPDPNWQVASCDVGQGDATVVRSAGQIALIDTGKYEDKIVSCLDKLAVSHISLLVLTHYDLDHVGAVSAAVRGRTVDMALVTSFHDDRAGANWVRTALDLAHIQATPAERGMAGQLGHANWLVLNPDHDGGDAEDSNDGSIALLFNLESYNLLALADLGERGQMRIAKHLGQWYNQQVASIPLVMKVAHHGSADQYPELIEAVHPAVALVSVGKNNGYGHPTSRTLDVLGRAGSLIARTDLLGSISIGVSVSMLAVAGGG